MLAPPAPPAAAARPCCRRLQQQAPARLRARRALTVAGAAAHSAGGAASAATRRETLALGPALLLATGAAAVAAAGEARAEGPAAAAAATQQYVDPAEGFSLTLPAGWQQGEGLLEGNRSFQGSSGQRRTLAWYPPDVPAGELNITLTITNTSVEFTSLGSFGNVFAFGTNLVNSMDRSFLMRMRGGTAGTPEEPVQVAKLLDAAEAGGMYAVEYTVAKIPGPTRHLWSLVALAPSRYYNRLYTLNAQCLEEQAAEAGPVLRQVLASFVPPAGTA